MALALSLFLSICVISQSNAESGSGLFEANVKALAKVGHEGTCAKDEGLCIAICPECGKLVEAIGVKGPSTGVSEKEVVDEEEDDTSEEDGGK